MTKGIVFVNSKDVRTLANLFLIQNEAVGFGRDSYNPKLGLLARRIVQAHDQNQPICITDD